MCAQSEKERYSSFASELRGEKRETYSDKRNERRKENALCDVCVYVLQKVVSRISPHLMLGLFFVQPRRLCNNIILMPVGRVCIVGISVVVVVPARES